MSKQSPVMFRWNGDAMEPASQRWVDTCNERYVVGQVYSMEEVHQRSDATHAHYFAVLHQAWLSLPDDMAAQFPTDDHLRAHCLIKAGFCEKRSVNASSITEARKLAVWARPLNPLAIITTEGTMVTIWTAMSQNYRSMDKATFQRSKQAVLEILDDMLGTARGTVEKNEAGA